jgi:hypothetical protein
MYVYLVGGWGQKVLRQQVHPLPSQKQGVLEETMKATLISPKCW